MREAYHTHPKSQAPQAKSRKYREKYKRVRKTRDGGFPFPPIPQERVLHRIVHHVVEKSTKADKAILNTMVRCCFSNPFVFPSQTTIGKLAGGYCRETVSRCLLKWERLGLVSNNHRWNKTSLYNIASIFWDKNFIRKLKKWLPALLLLLNVNVTRSSNLSFSILSLIKSPSPSPIRKRDSRIGTRKGLKFSNKKENLVSEVSKDVKEAIGSMGEVRLSYCGMAKLAVFPAEAIKHAHKQLKDLTRKGQVINDKFALLFNACKKHSPHVDVSHSNPILVRLQQSLCFSFQDPRTNPETKKTTLYDQEALAKRAKNIQSKYSNNDYGKPNYGDPITNEHIEAQSRRITGRSYEFPKKQIGVSVKEPYVSYDTNKYNRYASCSFSEIFDGWEKAWQLTVKGIGINHPVLDKDLARRAILQGMKRNIDLHLEHGIDNAINYLKQKIFQTQAPDSVQRGTILTENEYYSFLTEILENYEKEVEKQNARQENYNTR